MRNQDPVHGVWCSARIKKTACGACGHPVGLFFCDCGNLVMVNGDNGPPRVHACVKGQNQFSAMDGFVAARLCERPVTQAELATGAAGDMVLVSDEVTAAPLETWIDGQVREVSGSLIPERMH